MDKREFLHKSALSACGLFLGVRWNSPGGAPSLLAAGGEPDRWTKEALFYEKTTDGIQCRKWLIQE